VDKKEIYLTHHIHNR